jgi:proline dehydrogenase
MTSFASQAAFAVAEPQPSIDVPVRDLGRFEWENPRVAPPPLEFDNAQAAFAAHSSLSIMRSLAVFSLCSIKPMVKYADTILRRLKMVFGKTFINAIIKRTFFLHFCAGESGDDIKPTLHYLYKNGIGGILDYAAEDDVQSEGGPVSREPENEHIIARTFDYESEAKCDRHMETFMKSIRAAAASEGQGFAAVKVTALGQPKLLERVSDSLVSVHNLFRRFDEDLNGVVTRDEFEKVYGELFSDGTPERLQDIFNALEHEGSDPMRRAGVVDYLSWSQRLKLNDIPLLVKHCRVAGPVSRSALTELELELLHNMIGRLSRLAEVAAESNVRMMIDAEHSYFQPAINHAAVELQRRYNKEEPMIYNTYQCYLKDSHERLVMDLERARREGWFFGAKLVRGAYMVLERERAAKSGYPSPIHESIEDTHLNYNRCVAEVLEHVAGEGAEVMVATHNQASIEATVTLMGQLGIEANKNGVFFGQLLGMADHLTFTLGRNGYRGYKYVPFGPISEVMPYLIRRAQENSDMLGGVGHEMRLLRSELWRRFTKAVTGRGRVLYPPSSASNAGAVGTATAVDTASPVGSRSPY